MSLQLHWIAANAPPDAFPPVTSALREPDGLLASGGDLSVARLAEAYRRGIFPWYEDGQPVLWWAPDPRAFIFASNLHISRSLKRRLRKGGFQLSFDRDFSGVIRACAAPRPDQSGTWITPEMIRAYCKLHAAGLAHSVELWIDGQLAGGVYGVASGRMFSAESMFSGVSDASKIALTALLWQLDAWGFPGIDCQVRSAHLDSLGCELLPRTDFTTLLEEYRRLPGPSRWCFDRGLLARRGLPDCLLEKPSE